MGRFYEAPERTSKSVVYELSRRPIYNNYKKHYTKKKGQTIPKSPRAHSILFKCKLFSK